MDPLLKRFYRELLGPQTGARNPAHPQPNIRGIVQKTLFDPHDHEECAADVSEWIVQLVKDHIEGFPLEDVPQDITAVELFLRIVRGDKFFQIEQPNAYFRTMLRRKIENWKRQRQEHEPSVDDEAVEQPDPNYDADAQDRDIAFRSMIENFADQASEVHQFMLFRILKGSSVLEAAKIVRFVNKGDLNDPELTNILNERSESEAAEIVELVKKGGLTNQPVHTLRTQFGNKLRTFCRTHYPDTLRALLIFIEEH